MLDNIFKDPFPDNLIIAMPLVPGGVEQATIAI
jgi:hypothetical protein